MRILLIGPGVSRKYGDRFYYSTARRLLNGFIRNGHFVMHVSDRDLADYALGFRALGKYYACHRIATIAAHVRPHLVVLLLADLITPEAIADIRKKSRGAKVVCVELDPIGNPTVAKRFSGRLDICDGGFVTTGGDVLSEVAGSRAGFHIPNLVDIAIDDTVAYEAAPKYDVFFSGSTVKEGYQWQRALELQAMAPGHNYCYSGIGKVGGMWGHDYIEAMGASRVGLNLNRLEGSLYASDRMGQYLGNGMLLATDRASGYDTIFDDDEMIFFASVAELAEKIARDIGPGEPWRAKARKARTKALEIMSSEMVCSYIVSRVFEDRPCEGWAFK